MYKVKNNLLPDCILRQFKTRGSQYELRGLRMFEKTRERTNLKSRCVSVKGVNLWSGCDEKLKMCNSFVVFKTIFKNKVVDSYDTQE